MELTKFHIMRIHEINSKGGILVFRITFYIMCLKFGIQKSIGYNSYEKCFDHDGGASLFRIM